MFCNCNLLKTISDFSAWGTKIVTDIIYLFYGYENLTNLSDFSKWNIENVTDMKYLF